MKAKSIETVSKNQSTEILLESFPKNCFFIWNVTKYAKSIDPNDFVNLWQKYNWAYHAGLSPSFKIHRNKVTVRSSIKNMFLTQKWSKISAPNLIKNSIFLRDLQIKQKIFIFNDLQSYLIFFPLIAIRSGDFNEIGGKVRLDDISLKYLFLR